MPRVNAPELIMTVTLVVAPTTSVPLVAERVTQLAVLAADQLRLAVPLLVTMYTWLEGLKGPPTVPLEVNPIAGLTDRAALPFTVRFTLRLVLPLPLVRLVKVTVSA